MASERTSGAPLERMLWDFGEKFLKPSDENLRTANPLVQKLSQELQRKSKYKIDRIIPSGSFGKATSLSQFYDNDLVAFINDVEPPFSKILDSFEQILDLSESLKIENVHKTAHSLPFILDGFSVDFLPATNYIKGLNLSGMSAVNHQREATIAQIQPSYAKSGRYDSSYSSAMSESQVGFMKNQSAFVHSLVRLCKFWMKTLQVEYIYGKSLMIQLIGVDVGRKVENGAKVSITQAFRNFLNQIIGLKTILINNFNPDERTPREILKLPVIMDPSNPYNNVARRIDAPTLSKLMEYAKETLLRLSKYEPLPILELIFDPQPIVAKLERGVPIPLVDIHGSVPYTHPNMIVHKGSKFDRIELEELKFRIDQSIVTKMQAMLAGGGKPRTSCYEVQKMVTNMVDSHVRGQPGMTWTHSYEKHEDYDVTFVIPFVVDDSKMSCWVSFKKL